jgi:hypothetical protein
MERGQKYHLVTSSRVVFEHAGDNVVHARGLLREACERYAEPPPLLNITTFRHVQTRGLLLRSDGVAA